MFGQRCVQRETKAHPVENNPNVPVRLHGDDMLQQRRSESPVLRLRDRWSTALPPFQMQPATVSCPEEVSGDLDAPLGH
jgi:hypothetical protein